LTIGAQEGPAGVARIDGGVGLDQSAAQNVLDGDGPVQPGHRSARESHRVAHRETDGGDFLTDTGGRGGQGDTCPEIGRSTRTRATSVEESMPTTTPEVVPPAPFSPAVRLRAADWLTTWATVATRFGAIRNPVPMSPPSQVVAWMRTMPLLTFR